MSRGVLILPDVNIEQFKICPVDVPELNFPVPEVELQALGPLQLCNQENVLKYNLDLK